MCFVVLDPPVVNKRSIPSKPAVAEKKPGGEATSKPPVSHPRSNSSSATHSAPVFGKKVTRNPSIQRDVKSAPPPKTDSAPKPETKKESISRHNSDTSEVILFLCASVFFRFKCQNMVENMG